MTTDQNEFIREATLRMCGSLQMEKNLHHLLGKIHDKEGAAEILGSNPDTPRSRMKKLGLQES